MLGPNRLGKVPRANPPGALLSAQNAQDSALASLLLQSPCCPATEPCAAHQAAALLRAPKALRVEGGAMAPAGAPGGNTSQ